MMKCYLHSAVSISTQHTFNVEDFFQNIVTHTSKKVNAIHPNYRDFISPVAARRMAIGVKMGVVAANKALEFADLKQPDAIITGTGMGCIEDTEKFLNGIIKNDEAYLTPTSFIQSTHNTVGSQIALGLKCHAYNNTYTHGSISFESALMDTLLMLKQREATHILVGGVDELGTEFVDYVQMMEDKESKGITVPFSEGASFFVVSSEEKSNAIQLQDVITINSASNEELKLKLKTFLNENQLKTNDIDAVILGNNGDVFDTYYEHLASALFSNTSQIHYKHLIGEYYTASAFSFWLASQLIQKQYIPSEILKNSVQKKEIKNVLLYNQFKGENHSFILLKK